ncbi:hypothetical protein MLD38_034257 [Melastoma candidum]|uniref:Uncharacterized protein n=1 Tax=Melastoma candidum TaxID=119954 RepID=A0ACB9M9C2_9MYRT|nr:hypothetical protein MLD38_034257 [Melastoma candidum]
MALHFITALLTVMFLVFVGRARSQTRVFDVRQFGAVNGGKIDSSDALLSAWRQACSLGGMNVIRVPRGTFLLSPTILAGPCRGSMELRINGILRASAALSSLDVDYWIVLQRIDDLNITGDGVLDGQGHSAWKYNDCFWNPKCKTLPTTLRLQDVNNTLLHDIASVNSKSAHLSIFACQNVSLERVKLTAPGDSPNTDGIRVGMSSYVFIRDSVIGTGDDCIAMNHGSVKIIITNVTCGPGHGISIGSLGGSPDENPVRLVWVGNCSFVGTTNGLRIKTKATSYRSLVSGITFADIHVENVTNPIIIDQQYCPSHTCDPKAVSLVAIHYVKYKNITGTSSSQVAVNLQCSPAAPCLNVTLQDIDLSYHGDTTSSCSNVFGSSSGIQHPPPCVNNRS